MSSPAVVPGAASPNRLGFCQRCGDPISGKIRCSRCGGASKEPRVRSTQTLPAAKKPDPWAHRYVHADSSSQDQAEEYLHDQPPPLSPKRMNHDPALGFGMPSRISRDLRTSATTNDLKPHPTSSSQLSPAAVEQDSRRASQDYTAPVVKGSDGVLSKVCGSLVEPSESRNRWACSDCAAVFARDSTLYAAPASLPAHDAAFYCRECYAKRYSLGECRACARAVLGSTKEDGKYVKASSGVWHGKCWKCKACAKGAVDGAEILVGMDGEPTCEGCFDRPRRKTAVEPRARADAEAGVPDVRRITRVGAARTGAMGATIAELTKKLGQQSVSSARIPFSTRSSSNTSIPTASSSHSSLDAPPRSPSKGGYAFPNHVPTSPGKSAMTRSGSLTGSPPKPRPLTAQFRDGMNLAAFKPSFAGEGERERVSTRDSRSRSVSPVKRAEWSKAKTGESKEAEAAKVRAGSKVPGSPSLAPASTASTRIDISPQDRDRRRTSLGFPRPLNSPFSPHGTDSEPVQGDKPTTSSPDLAAHLEPATGTTRCSACHRLPFDLPSAAATQQVRMVTLSDGVHLHAECFRCAVCAEGIEGSKAFVRLSGEGAGAGAYAHPACAPTVHVVVRAGESEGAGGQKSFRSTLDPAPAGSARSHATHQRELRPSAVPSPAASLRATPAVLPTPNPAAGIFARTRLPPADKLGGMHTCAWCGDKLSPLEATLGPRGTQWHRACLVCRAPPAPQPHGVYYVRGKQPKLMCGKRLDSGAKVNGDGEVRCRECLDRESGAFRVKV
ncbi:conserved hypothetical protein [Sporisorium reilianum SRZ2]|uniref:LIM zinc-binding domain-containing protein n=1 Tax=Sporisorium reilianum (strain SRZ2) TaxID=999809 RepID=E6ZVL4_SPORE|nr:conserved hypothetical protein [Sporisorium reilianum SRZ2]